MLRCMKHFPWGRCQTCHVIPPASSACWPSSKGLIKHTKRLASWRLEHLQPFGGEQVCGLRRIYTFTLSVTKGQVVGVMVYRYSYAYLSQKKKKGTKWKPPFAL